MSAVLSIPELPQSDPSAGEAHARPRGEFPAGEFADLFDLLQLLASVGTAAPPGPSQVTPRAELQHAALPARAEADASRPAPPELRLSPQLPPETGIETKTPLPQLPAIAPRTRVDPELAARLRETTAALSSGRAAPPGAPPESLQASQAAGQSAAPPAVLEQAASVAARSPLEALPRQLAERPRRRAEPTSLPPSPVRPEAVNLQTTASPGAKSPDAATGATQAPSATPNPLGTQVDASRALAELATRGPGRNPQREPLQRDVSGMQAQPTPLPTASPEAAVAPLSVPGAIASPPPAPALASSGGAAVAQRVEWLAQSGGGSARVVLHPAELGEVEIAVRVRGSRVDVSIQTEVPTTRLALLDARDSLGDALAARELRIESLDIRVAEARPGNGGDGSALGTPGRDAGFDQNANPGAHREGPGDRPGQRDASPWTRVRDADAEERARANAGAGQLDLHL